MAYVKSDFYGEIETVLWILNITTEYCAKVMIANFVEFRRSSTKFYVNLRNFEENEFSAKFRWPLLFHHYQNFVQMCEISLGKFAEGGKIRSKFRQWERNFVRNFASGSKISNEISQVGAKFQTKFPTLCLCERNLERKSRLEIEISFTIRGYTRVTKCRMQTEGGKKTVH